MPKIAHPPFSSALKSLRYTADSVMFRNGNKWNEGRRPFRPFRRGAAPRSAHSPPFSTAPSLHRAPRTGNEDQRSIAKGSNACARAVGGCRRPGCLHGCLHGLPLQGCSRACAPAASLRFATRNLSLIRNHTQEDGFVGRDSGTTFTQTLSNTENQMLCKPFGGLSPGR